MDDKTNSIFRDLVGGISFRWWVVDRYLRLSIRSHGRLTPNLLKDFLRWRLAVLEL